MKTTEGVTRLRMLRDILVKRNSGDGSDEGFTLIELMVVLLIMAILLAIAIPTFLGVTSGAKVTAAQSNLTNGVITAKTVYQKGGGYPIEATMQSDMKKEDPAIQWVGGTTEPKAGTSTISIYDAATATLDTTVIILTAADSNGGCWVTSDNERTSVTGKVPSGEAYGWAYIGTVATACEAKKVYVKMKAVKATGAQTQAVATVCKTGTPSTGNPTTIAKATSHVIGWNPSSFKTICGTTLTLP